MFSFLSFITIVISFSVMFMNLMPSNYLMPQYHFFNYWALSTDQHYGFWTEVYCKPNSLPSHIYDALIVISIFETFDKVWCKHFLKLHTSSLITTSVAGQNFIFYSINAGVYQGSVRGSMLFLLSSTSYLVRLFVSRTFRLYGLLSTHVFPFFILIPQSPSINSV